MVVLIGLIASGNVPEGSSFGMILLTGLVWVGLLGAPPIIFYAAWQAHIKKGGFYVWTAFWALLHFVFSVFIVYAVAKSGSL